TDTSVQKRFFTKRAENCLRFFVLPHLTRLFCGVASLRPVYCHGICRRGDPEKKSEPPSRCGKKRQGTGCYFTRAPNRAHRADGESFRGRPGNHLPRKICCETDDEDERLSGDRRCTRMKIAILGSGGRIGAALMR